MYFCKKISPLRSRFTHKISRPVRFAKPYWSFLFGLIYFFLYSTEAQAASVGPNDSYYLVQDFKTDWQVYDERYKSYVPFIRERHQNYRSVSVLFNLEENRGYNLLYYSQSDSYLFIDASLQKKLDANTWMVLRVDSLLNSYKKSEILLTFFGNNPGIDNKTLLVGNRISVIQKKALLNEKQLTAQTRPISPYRDFFITVGLFLLVINAFLFNFHLKAFERYYNLRDVITFSKRIDLNAPINRPFEISNVLFILHLSLLLAYLYLFVASKEVSIFSVSNILEETETFIGFLLTYLQITFIILCCLLAKYLTLVLLGSLYRLEKITNIHFFKIIQASHLFFLGLTIIFLPLYFTTPSLPQSIVQMVTITVISFFIVRLGILYFTINKLVSLKNLYLFSYLCIVELIPLIVGVRFAL